MKKTALCLVAFFILAIGSNACAGGDSPFSVKLCVRGARYFTSDGVVTNTYPAENDSPSILNARNAMQYDFDDKFGKGIAAAIGVAASRNVEVEIGFSYTAMSLDVIQWSRYWWGGVGGEPSRYSSYQHDADADPVFRAYGIHPGINLILTAGSRIRPYIGARINVLYVVARADMIIARPYVVQEGSNYILFAGKDAETEPFRIDDSALLFGVGFESGLEFRVSGAMSIVTGIALDIHFTKAFSSFADMIENEDIRGEIEELGYEFEGIEYTNISALIGMKYYL